MVIDFTVPDSVLTTTTDTRGADPNTSLKSIVVICPNRKSIKVTTATKRIV